MVLHLAKAPRMPVVQVCGGGPCLKQLATEKSGEEVETVKRYAVCHYDFTAKFDLTASTAPPLRGHDSLRNVYLPSRFAWFDGFMPEQEPMYVAQFPRPDHFIVHLSDTHLVAGDRPLYGSIDSESHLRRLFAELEASGARPEALIFTGDLADVGDAESYATLRSIVDPAAARLGAQVIWVMGNHDDRGNFRTGLLDQYPATNPIDRVYDVNGLRIIALDSTVPGHHHGLVTDAQLDWLAEELSYAAPHGTILAMHHPPVPSVQDLAILVELRAQDALAEVIRGSDVRSIIAGHLHYSTMSMFAGVPVSVASATCYTQDLNVSAAPDGSRGTRARDGAQSFNLVHVYEDTVLHSVVPLGTFESVSYTSPQETADKLRAHNVVIRPSTTAPAPIDEDLNTRPLELAELF